MRAAERGEGLAEAGGGQQSIFEITWRHEHDVEIASERAMLKAIVQQVHVPMELRLGNLPCLVAAFADDDWHGKSSRDQQRLIAEIGHAPAGRNHQNAASFPP